MRHDCMKRISKKHSTKTERIMYEILKELHVPFKHRWMVNNREIDFIVGNLAIEIDGHEQAVIKNKELLELGYIPVHYRNIDILEHRTEIKEEIKQLLNKYYGTTTKHKTRRSTTTRTTINLHSTCN